jgi:hypothetical protein
MTLRNPTTVAGQTEAKSTGLRSNSQSTTPHNYAQMQGREELFERERHREPVAGWHSCELACAEVEQ